ncbi:MAG TPA: hypothetical protein DEB06_03110 [Phycisphaerales bacterium]|nr:hypothetical protein [Phycisphaerales bacterium]
MAQLRPTRSDGDALAERHRACCAEGDPRRWKNAPLAQRVFILHNLIMRTADRLVEPHGLTSSRWLLLGALEQFESPPTLSELSGNALLSLQNVSRMVASLEADGLVERYTLAGRGRSVFVRLTARGVRTLEEAESAAVVFARGLLAGLDAPTVDDTERRLERLITNLEGLERRLESPGEGGRAERESELEQR